MICDNIIKPFPATIHLNRTLIVFSTFSKCEFQVFAHCLSWSAAVLLGPPCHFFARRGSHRSVISFFLSFNLRTKDIFRKTESAHYGEFTVSRRATKTISPRWGEACKGGVGKAMWWLFREVKMIFSEFFPFFNRAMYRIQTVLEVAQG